MGFGPVGEAANRWQAARPAHEQPIVPSRSNWSTRGALHQCGASELLLLVTEEQRQQQADGEAENGDGSREQTAVNWARRDPRRRGRSRLDRFKTRRGGAGVL